MPVGTVDFAFTQPNSNLASFTHATSYPGHADSKFDLSTGRRGVAAAFVAGKFVTAGGQLRDVQNGDLNGTKLISYARIADDGIPQTWVDASTVDSGAVLTNNLVDVDGAAWNSTLYIPGGRATSAFGTGADGASTAYSDVLVVPMNADPNDTGFATSGTLESRIIDLGGLTNVKHITVSGSLLSSIDVRYRLGNADGVWSDWFTASSADADITGGARYFQYSIVLRGGSSTPAVTSVTITTAKGGVVPFTTDDVKRALQLAAGLDKASSADMARLDVDGAAGITAGDAVKIQRALNGK